MNKSLRFLLGFSVSLFFMPVLMAQEQFTKVPDKPVDVTKDKNLYTVGYAHLDTQWRWTYARSIEEYIPNTMQNNFRLLDKYPNYIFNFTGSRRYEFMKEYYPADYEKVKQYVKEGRWFPAGSSVDENDANIPDLESFERQFLYGNHFFQREFGVTSQEYMLPDCFGFPASLPSMVAHGGLKGFSTQKLGWGSAVGIPFPVGQWEGPDGATIIGALDPKAYVGQVTNDLSKDEMWLGRITKTGDQSGAYVDYHYFGTGDRGGAPDENSVRRVQESLTSDGPVRVMFTKADQMYKDITPEEAAKMPHYKGELLLTNHSAGSITSEAYMKRWNRKNELLADAAERSASAAFWMGAMPYPSDPLKQAWDLVLGSQMHDIMPGTSLPQAYSFAWNDEVLALNHFATVEQSAASAVISGMNTSGKGVPLVVYNPLSIEREDVVDATIPYPSDPPTSVTAYDGAGQPVPTQVIGKDGNSLKILVLAKVPAVGYAAFDVRPGDYSGANGLQISNNSLENSHYRVTIDTNGSISSIFDKLANKEMFSEPNSLTVNPENPSAFPAWNMDWQDRIKPPRLTVGAPAQVRVVESGPVRVSLEVERSFEGSTITEQIRLSAGGAGDRVENDTHLDWQSTEASLRSRFHFAFGNPAATFDGTVGVVSRPNSNSKCFEMPMHQWMDLTSNDGSYGVSVLNDCKYGGDKPDDHTLGLTLVYTPGTRGGFQDQGTQDHGRHEMLYAFYGHPGDWSAGKTEWQAARLNQPLRSFLPPAHDGPLGKSFSLMSLNTDSVEVTSLKKAEDSDELVVRVKELFGKPASVKLTFAAPILSAREVNGQEAQVGPATVTNGALSFDLKPYGVRAFAFKPSVAPQPLGKIVSQPIPLNYDLDVASTYANRTDGAMDQEGDTYPAEMLPAHLEREGVEFKLGSTADGAKNALKAQGQDIPLPAGSFNRVYLLAASCDGDVSDAVKIDGNSYPIHVESWKGYVGQWDTRIWDAPIPEVSYSVEQHMVGLVPGYIKRASVAWFDTQYYTPTGHAFYRYSYIYRYGFDLPKGATKLTLPKNDKIRVFAISVAQEDGGSTALAAPLYDTLEDHQVSNLAPSIPQAGKTFNDTTSVSLCPALYYLPNDLHYTVDGSEPTAASPLYQKAFMVSRKTTVKARQINPDGSLSPVTSGVIDVEDTTSPTITNIEEMENPQQVEVKFTEPVNPATATATEQYQVTPLTGVSKVEMLDDNQGVRLTLASPLMNGTAYMLSVKGVKDCSPAGNAIVPVQEPVDAFGVDYSLISVKLPDNQFKKSVPNLPLKGRDSWTINFLVNPTAKAEDQTLIAGFGLDDDNSGKVGQARYIGVMGGGIHFWGKNADVDTNSPLEVGRWQMLTATYNGKTVVMYKDGEIIGKKEVKLTDDPNEFVGVGIPDPWIKTHRLEGWLQAFTIRRGALNAGDVKKLSEETKPIN